MSGGRLERAALADVLAVLTTESDAAWWRGVVSRYAAAFDGAVVLGVAGGGVAYDVGRLRCADPAEALAALVEAEALPEHWTDAARAPRWWCEECAGKGDGRWRSTVVVSCPCRGEHRTAPPSLPDLVAVASLGAASLARAEAIVAETWPGRALVFRVMPRSDIEEHHRETFDHGGAVSPAHNCSAVAALYPADLPAMLEWMSDDHVNRPLAGAVIALMRREDGAPTGLHLVALDAGCVVLAVEAL